MASLQARLAFFLTSAKKRIQGTDMQCPVCGVRRSSVVDRKFGVLSLERCEECGLLFRAPGTTAKESHRYYQTSYRRGITTDVPDEETLARLLRMKFCGSGQDFTDRISILKGLGVKDGARVLDFGCSWGYGTWQLREAGFDAVGFEVSRPRADFARARLGIPMIEEPWNSEEAYDVVFSAHVIEHVPDPVDILRKAIRSLRKGGLWVSFCPNGSVDFRNVAPTSWHRLWGLDHPCFPDRVFFQKHMAELPFLIATTPCPQSLLRDWVQSQGQACLEPLASAELLVVFRKI